MKTICLILILFPIVMYAQKPPLDVPAPAKQALAKQYPDATELSWEMKKDRYRAKFKTGKVDHKVWMDASGAVSRHEYEIKKDQLPEAITAAVAKDFSGYTIGDCEKNEEGSTTTYKVELKNPKNQKDKKHVTYLADGKVVPKKTDD